MGVTVLSHAPPTFPCICQNILHTVVPAQYLVNGFYTRCSPDFYNITGRRPTTYYEYLTIEGESGETGLEELWQGNLWEKGVDAMKDAAKTVA